MYPYQLLLFVNACLLVGINAYTPTVIQEPLFDIGHTAFKDSPNNQIITGLYGYQNDTPAIQIHDIDTNVGWEWKWEGASGVNQYLKTLTNLTSCLNGTNYWSATEVKFARNGTLIAAIYANAAVVIHREPGDKTMDKKVLFATCTNDLLGNAHTVEVLPGNKLAVATSGKTSDDGFLVFNMSSPLSDSPKVLQQIKGLRAVHGLIWDEHAQMLWANGLNEAPDGGATHPAQAVLQGYYYDKSTELLEESRTTKFQFPCASDLHTEWGGGAYATWWDGPHDLAPVPNERKLLLTTDLDVYVFDINKGAFERGECAQSDYLKGFRSLGSRRGVNSQGREDVSLGLNDSLIYVQAPWKSASALGNQINVYHNGVYIPLFKRWDVYRSRWFADVPGWPKPRF
ncbi:unnamed protein product [Penicillium bialowiezense]